MEHTKAGSHTHTTKSGFVHSRIDEATKEQAAFILDKMGLNVSDAIRIFLNQVVMHRGMPFQVKIPNQETIAALEAAEKGENLEQITLDELHAEFKQERKKLTLLKKKRKYKNKNMK